MILVWADSKLRGDYHVEFGIKYFRRKLFSVINVLDGPDLGRFQAPGRYRVEFEIKNVRQKLFCLINAPKANDVDDKQRTLTG